ncbi:shikimate kinase [Yeosuana sp. MJ-SS3]|uniref:Shikimate kinase n=1 Tax=Gilvirhabdus luticola TaxID=3079858 RepID=A0ABU3U6U2_9FLAO|nr:shikimate kinase [Yeosuana sp. MJ-SS3]MDU8886119.1 shikimate kinase [Yeosuana sp. MJ-SS3]
MVVILLGYMTSGKSTIGKVLAQKLDYVFLDLDTYIEKREAMNVANIFKTKGEIYFRKLESIYLQEIISSYQNTVLALGGGTPCYANNMEVILKLKKVTSIYLKVSLHELVDRLEKEKHQRPLVSHLKTKNEILEFVGKHLFERSNYYNQANLVIDTDDKSVDEIIEDIIIQLF